MTAVVRVDAKGPPAHDKPAVPSEAGADTASDHELSLLSIGTILASTLTKVSTPLT